MTKKSLLTKLAEIYTSNNFLLAWLGIVLTLGISFRPTAEAAELSKADEFQRGNVFFYGDSVYLPRSSNLIFEGKLHYGLSSWAQITPYLGFTYGQDLRSNSRSVYNDNHITPLLGLRYNPTGFPITVFAEVRENFRLIKPPSSPLNERDLRVGTYLYKWFDLATLKTNLTLFQETYGEIIFTSMLRNDILFDGWAKQGVRSKVSPSFSLDGYLEAAGGTDRLNVADYKSGQLALGLRANVQVAKTLTQFLVKKIWPVEFLTPSPLLQTPWSAQLVFTGEI